MTMIQSFQYATNPSLRKSLPYDTLSDFTVIATVASQALVVTFNPSIPANRINNFIAVAKANPDKYNYASDGAGSSQHFLRQALQQNCRHLGGEVAHIMRLDELGNDPTPAQGRALLPESRRPTARPNPHSTVVCLTLVAAAHWPRSSGTTF